MKYAKIRKMDISNGPGIRTTLFVSGCTFNCEGCFNKKAQSFDYGLDWTEEVEDDFIEYTNHPNIIGVNLLGGEPFQQDKDIMIHILKRIKEETGKSIWTWTGYLIDNLLDDEKSREMLKYIDVLVDGRFENDKRNLMLMYRGSSNQRVIDVKKTLETGSVVEL